MKKISIAFFSGMLFLAACDNGGSSTVGSYDREETQSTTSERKESSSGEAHSGAAERKEGTTEPATRDTANAEMNAGNTRGGSEKSGVQEESHPQSEQH